MKPGKKMFWGLIFLTVLFTLLAIFGIGDGFKSVRKMRFGIDIRGGVEAVFEPQGIQRKATEKELVMARTVIESRLDAKKIADREVTIDKKEGYIIVRFPWKSTEKNFNPEEAIQELGETAQLTFRDSEGNILVEGKNVESAEAAEDKSNLSNSYLVKLSFNDKGAKQFEEATGKLINQPMGIYMDEKKISEPIVQTKISGGEAVIDKISSYEEAESLAEKINSGALPFSLKTTDFSTISPSLGNHALSIMVIAGVAAFVIICLFMCVYYKLSGVVASVTLLLQAVLQLLAISVPQYTLTLPGIAGIILSIGMAVDANIIISERISEEIRDGKSVKSAILKGYQKAFSSVLDGNVTTAVIAVILMLFGSGSMLSFGYTLLVGMIVNVLVGVTYSKYMLLSLAEIKKWSKKTYFREKKKVMKIRFYEKRNVFLFISIGIFVVGIASCFIRGVKMDTQFTGGAVLSYAADKGIDSEKISEKIENEIGRPATIQVTKNRADGRKEIVVTLAGKGGLSPEKQKKVTALLKKEAPQSDVKLSETYAVEPYIGKKALENAAIAMLLSIAFIVVYIWCRFAVLKGLSAGITAALALIHDVCVVFFTFVIFGIPLNDAFVAVVLTIIGFSINDTIVLYDRIRENEERMHKKPMEELVNLSINETFGRTINTSITTGISVFVLLLASFLFQISSIQEFSLPMFFGLISGCYSTICIASILWARWQIYKRKQRVEKLATEEREKLKESSV